jgi:hypothetical protein
MDTPWDDMKVAFSVDDDAAVWDAFGTTTVHRQYLPDNWELVETDASGARYVAVFRVEGFATKEDGETVERILVRCGARK